MSNQGKIEVTTTAGVPVYFPGPRLDKESKKKKKRKPMKEVERAVKLVMEGNKPSEALKIVLGEASNEFIKKIQMKAKELGDSAVVTAKSDSVVVKFDDSKLAKKFHDMHKDDFDMSLSDRSVKVMES